MSETGKGAIITIEALYEAWVNAGNADIEIGLFKRRFCTDWLSYIFVDQIEFRGAHQDIKDLPGDVEHFHSHFSVNDENFWLVREAFRMNIGLDVKYERPECWRNIMNLKPALRFHFLHASVNDPTMVAFTPSHAYGKADRQVRVKLGKYLMTYYRDVLSEAQIKDLVSGNANTPISWGSERADFKNVYINGPDSCMSGDDEFSCGRYHPTEAYASGEFKIAYVQRDGDITARTVVHEPSKTFVRLYGSDGDRLQSALLKQGYTKASAYPNGAKLLVIEYDGGYVLPYIDGNARYVRLSGKFFEISNSSGMFHCDDTGGLYRDEDTRSCDCCGDNYCSDELTEVECGDMVCEGCLDSEYTMAYVSSTNRRRQGWIRNDDAVEVDGNYYLDSHGVFALHGIQRCDYSDEYCKTDDMVTLRNEDLCDPDYALSVGENKDGDTLFEVPENITLDFFVKVGPCTTHYYSYGEDDTFIGIVQFLAPDCVDVECSDERPLPSNIIPLIDAINLDLKMTASLSQNYAMRNRLDALKAEQKSAIAAMQQRAA